MLREVARIQGSPFLLRFMNVVNHFSINQKWNHTIVLLMCFRILFFFITPQFNCHSFDQFNYSLEEPSIIISYILVD